MHEFDIFGAIEASQLTYNSAVLKALGQRTLNLVKRAESDPAIFFDVEYLTRTSIWTTRGGSNCRLDVREGGPASFSIVTPGVDEDGLHFS